MSTQEETQLTLPIDIKNDPEYNTHIKFMKEALNMAEEAYQEDEVPVGCVFVHNGEILCRGRNKTNETKNGTTHAELVAIDTILTNENISQRKYTPDVFKNSDLYVTVEPCIMCASALRQIGLEGVGRPDGRSPPVPITVGGYCHDEAIYMLRKFYVKENVNAPNPKKKANRILKTNDLVLEDSQD
ncbi:tRNA(adenine34) deaminase [Mycoemilia scoparia]|uniref:tRNA(Adenine34) deaminase n=1 Tax=Mycoemilia scoparia TaxID=417184 RepID=A0A9W8A593_9FUNG|nr:tRNA(adenine34) deaminase [Mycoemilia scoparia]